MHSASLHTTVVQVWHMYKLGNFCDLGKLKLPDWKSPRVCSWRSCRGRIWSLCYDLVPSTSVHSVKSAEALVKCWTVYVCFCGVLHGSSLDLYPAERNVTLIDARNGQSSAGYQDDLRLLVYISSPGETNHRRAPKIHSRHCHHLPSLYSLVVPHRSSTLHDSVMSTTPILRLHTTSYIRCRRLEYMLSHTTSSTRMQS